MTDENPFNFSKFGQPIRDGVIMTDMAMLKHLVDLCAIQADFMIAAGVVMRLRERSEGAVGRKFEVAEVLEADALRTHAIVGYGRCFVQADGRRKLDASDVKRLGGDASIHEELMQQRHEVIAHRAKVHSRTELFALLDLPNRRLRTLALLESVYPFPPIPRLREWEGHLNTLVASQRDEIMRYQESLLPVLRERHLDEIFRLCEARSRWPK